MKELSISVPDGLSAALTNQIQTAAQMSVSDTLMATKSKWEQIAQQRLNTTRADYLLGLNADNSLEFPDKMTGVLTLRGKWPNKLEDGFSAFDIKDGLMNGPNVKRKKDGGWYNTVPFRHRTPGHSGSAVGGSEMPTDIYSRARAMRGNVQRLTSTETAYPPQTSWKGYTHKNGLYEGMVRNRKKYEKAIQSTYVTFRRVSDKSDPKAFWHPGFVGIKAVDSVVPFAEKTFKEVLEVYLKEFMG